MSDDHERIRTDLGGYVLGGLTLDEQHEVERHLAGCAACQAELAELDPLPVMLDLADPRPEAVAPPSAPPALQPGTSAAPGPSRGTGPHGHAVANDDATVEPTPRRLGRTRRRAIGLATAALAVAAALIVGVMIGRPSPPSFSSPIALQAVSTGPGTLASDGVPSGTASLRATDAGTVVRLDLTGLPVADSSFFECIWTSNQGTQSAGTFRAVADGSARVDLLTAVRRYPGWTLVIVAHTAGDQHGQPVLHADA